MSKQIDILVEIREKGTITVRGYPDSLNTKTPLPQWRILYNNGGYSDYKLINQSVDLNPGQYQIEFEEVDGYTKPSNFSFILEAGEKKNINAVYSKNNTTLLRIDFVLPTFYQKYLSWKLVRPGNTQDKIIINENNNLKYEGYLVNGKYQIQIRQYSFETEDRNIYDYSGVLISNQKKYIKAQNIDIELNGVSNGITLNYEQLSQEEQDRCGLVCVHIQPTNVSSLTKWKLIAIDDNTQSVEFNSGATVKVPYGDYYIVGNNISGWTIDNETKISVKKYDVFNIADIKYIQHGNLRIKINKGYWRIVGSTQWYNDGDEISLFPNTYEIEFEDVEYYVKPNNIVVNINENEITTETLQYLSYGKLNIIVEDDGVISLLDPTYWRKKNDTVWHLTNQEIYIEPGEHIIEFNTINNIYTHEDIVVTIDPGSVNEITTNFIGLKLLSVPTKSGINFFNLFNLQRLSINDDIESITTCNQVSTSLKYIALALDEYPYLKIFETVSVKEVQNHDFIPPIGQCKSIKFSNNGQLLAVSFNVFPYLTVYNTNDWSTYGIAELPGNYCNCLEFSKDDSYLCVGNDYNNYLKVYETSNFSEIQLSEYPTSEVISCNFNPQDSILAVGLQNQVLMYDTSDWSRIDNNLNISGNIYGLEFIDNYLFLISSLYYYVYSYNYIDNIFELDNQIVPPISNINRCLGYETSQNKIIIGCAENPYVLIYDFSTLERIEFSNALLSYCNKFDISKDFSEREFVIAPINETPEDRSNKYVSLDTLTSSSFQYFSLTLLPSGGDDETHDKSQWRILNNDLEIIYDSGQTDDLISHTFSGVTFNNPGQYYWQVRHKGTRLGWSEWSQRTLFTTIGSYIQKPINSSPVDEETDITHNPTLISSEFIPVNESDTHDLSQWKIYLIDGNNQTQIYNSGSINSLTSFDVPLGILTLKSDVYSPVYGWQVRYKGLNLGWSQWSDITTFETALNEFTNPVNVSPIDTETDVNENTLVLIASEFPTALLENHTHSRWEIREQTNPNILYHTSGEIIDTEKESMCEYVVPPGIITDGEKTYLWRVSYKGSVFGWSDWSEPTSFTTRELQKAIINVTITPNTILPGKTTPLRWRWKEISETLYSEYKTAGVGIEINSDQTIIIEFESHANYITPSPITLVVVAGQTYNYNIVYTERKTSLTFNLTPSNARWSFIGTNIWFDSDYVEQNLSYGVYTIEFEPVIGYLTPDPQVVTANSSLISLSKVYNIDLTAYDLRVITKPLNSRWKLDGEEVWYYSGDILSLDGESEVTIVFDGIDGFTTPDPITILIPDDILNYSDPYNAYRFSVTGEYEYSNKCFVNFISNIGSWRFITDTDWRDMNQNYLVDSGSNTVIFKDISGFITPDNLDITVIPNTTELFNVFYEVDENIPIYGQLQVIYKLPYETKTKTLLTHGKISIGSNTYYDEEIISLTPGTYTINFPEIDGFTSPTSEIVTIEENQLIIVEKTYIVDNDFVFYTFNINPVNARWKLVGADEWLLSGQINKIDVSGYTDTISITVEFENITNYDKPNDNILFINKTNDVYNQFTPKDVEYNWTGDLNKNIEISFNTGHGRWRIIGNDEWLAPGNYKFEPGSYEIEFLELDGFNKISNWSFIVDDIESIVKYFEYKNCGYLKIQTNLPNKTQFYDGSGEIKSTNTSTYYELYPGDYKINYEDVQGYSPLLSDTISIERGEYNTINKYYKTPSEVVDLIYLNVIPDNVITTPDLKYRFTVSEDGINWNVPWSEWISYFIRYNDGVLMLNNVFSTGGYFGYYKFEFSDIPGFNLNQKTKIVKFEGIPTDITIDYSNGLLDVKYGKIVPSLLVLDSRGVQTSISNELLDQIEFKYAIVDGSNLDSILNDKNQYTWNNNWIKYNDFSKYFSAVDKTKQYVFQIKPINNYFNYGDTGQLYKVNFNSSNAYLKIKLMNYNFNSIYFEIIFDPSYGYFSEYFEDIYFNIRTKNDYYDVYSSPKQVFINSDVIYRNINGVQYPIVRSREYTLNELFGINQLGYIIKEQINLSVNNYIMSDVDINMINIIRSNGYCQIMKATHI